MLLGLFNVVVVLWVTKSVSCCNPRQFVLCWSTGKAAVGWLKDGSCGVENREEGPAKLPFDTEILFNMVSCVLDAMRQTFKDLSCSSWASADKFWAFISFRRKGIKSTRQMRRRRLHRKCQKRENCTIGLSCSSQSCELPHLVRKNTAEAVWRELCSSHGGCFDGKY